jgi:hypothetical protein
VEELHRIWKKKTADVLTHSAKVQSYFRKAKASTENSLNTIGITPTGTATHHVQAAKSRNTPQVN